MDTWKHHKWEDLEEYSTCTMINYLKTRITFPKINILSGLLVSEAIPWVGIKEHKKYYYEDFNYFLTPKLTCETSCSSTTALMAMVRG